MKRRIESIRAEYFQIPLKNPFILSIRSALHANVVRWHLRMDDGREFPGESVPVQYVTGETPESVLAAVPKIDALLHGALIEDLTHLIREIARVLPKDIAARAGVEIALYNAFSDEVHIPLEKLLGAANATLETDLTIARIPNALVVAREAWREGFRTFKVKVGGGPMEEDMDRILSIAQEFPEAIFRLDANQSLTPRTTVELAESLLRNDITLELIEQPVPKEDLAALDELSLIHI